MAGVFKKQALMIANTTMSVSELGATFKLALTSRLLYSHSHRSSKCCIKVFRLQEAKTFTIVEIQVKNNIKYKESNNYNDHFMYCRSDHCNSPIFKIVSEITNCSVRNCKVLKTGTPLSFVYNSSKMVGMRNMVFGVIIFGVIIADLPFFVSANHSKRCYKKK